MDGQLTAVYETHGKWIVAYIEEIPGVNTQGATLAEARANLKDALGLFLEANRAIAKQDIHGKQDVLEERFALVEQAA